MEPLASTALVWPEGALLEGAAMAGKTAEALRAEALGLYTGLKLRHVPLAIIYDEQISAERLRGFRGARADDRDVAVGDPGASAGHMGARGGGRLIVFDSPAADPAGFRALPSALTELIGGTWTQTSKRARYTALVAEPAPAGLQGLGPLPLTLPYREVKASLQAQVWYRAAHSDDAAAPEDIEDLRVAEDPIASCAPRRGAAAASSTSPPAWAR